MGTKIQSFTGESISFEFRPGPSPPWGDRPRGIGINCWLSATVGCRLPSAVGGRSLSAVGCRLSAVNCGVTVGCRLLSVASQASSLSLSAVAAVHTASLVKNELSLHFMNELSLHLFSLEEQTLVALYE